MKDSAECSRCTQGQGLKAVYFLFSEMDDAIVDSESQQQSRTGGTLPARYAKYVCVYIHLAVCARLSVHQFILTICPPVCLCLSLLACLPARLSVSLSSCWLFCLQVFEPVCFNTNSLPVCLPRCCLSAHLSICPSTCKSPCPSVHLPASLPAHLSIYLQVSLHVCPSTCKPPHLSVN